MGYAVTAYHVDIQVACEKWQEQPDIKAVIRQACCVVLAAEAVNEEAELSVLLTDDVEVQALNKQYRDKDKPTNVLAFPNTAPLLGDIVLACETVKREAAEQHKSLPGHLQHLVVHATLHLLGYDHEQRVDAEIMEAREAEILAKLGIANPYEVLA